MEANLRLKMGSERMLAADEVIVAVNPQIDGAVAKIMGLDKAIRCGNESKEPVYDFRGLLIL